MTDQDEKFYEQTTMENYYEEVSKKNYVLGKTIDILAGVIIAVTFACLWLWFLKRFMLDLYCANY